MDLLYLKWALTVIVNVYFEERKDYSICSVFHANHHFSRVNKQRLIWPVWPMLVLVHKGACILACVSVCMKDTRSNSLTDLKTK